MRFPIASQKTCTALLGLGGGGDTQRVKVKVLKSHRELSGHVTVASGSRTYPALTQSSDSGITLTRGTKKIEARKTSLKPPCGEAAEKKDVPHSLTERAVGKEGPEWGLP